MSVWAADPVTLHLLAIFGFRQPVVASRSAAHTMQRRPISRRPTATPSPSAVYGVFNEGIMPSGGDGSASGLGEPGAQGQDISTMTGAQIASNLTTTAQLTLSTFTTGIALTAAPVAQAVAQALRGFALALGLTGKATAAAAEGQVTLSNPVGSAEFAEENPFTAGVLSLFGIHATAQPTAEELAAEAQSAHQSAVAAELGITNTATQGFAFEGGYVDINGNAIGSIGTLTTSESEIEVETEGAIATASAGISAGAISQGGVVGSVGVGQANDAATAAAAADAAAAAADAAAAGAAAAAAADAAAGQAAASAAADAGVGEGTSDGGGGAGGTGGEGE